MSNFLAIKPSCWTRTDISARLSKFQGIVFVLENVFWCVGCVFLYKWMRSSVPFRTKHPHKPQRNISYEKCQNISLKSLHICSYIQKTTLNPINAFKITSNNAKHTKQPNIFEIHRKQIERNSEIRTLSNIPSFYFVIYQNPIIFIIYILSFYEIRCIFSCI